MKLQAKTQGTYRSRKGPASTSEMLHRTLGVAVKRKELKKAGVPKGNRPSVRL